MAFRTTNCDFAFLDQRRVPQAAHGQQLADDDPEGHPLPPGVAPHGLAAKEELHHRPGKSDVQPPAGVAVVGMSLLIRFVLLPSNHLSLLLRFLHS